MTMRAGVESSIVYVHRDWTIWSRLFRVAETGSEAASECSLTSISEATQRAIAPAKDALLNHIICHMREVVVGGPRGGPALRFVYENAGGREKSILAIIAAAERIVREALCAPTVDGVPGERRFQLMDELIGLLLEFKARELRDAVPHPDWRAGRQRAQLGTQADWILYGDRLRAALAAGPPWQVDDRGLLVWWGSLTLFDAAKG